MEKKKPGRKPRIHDKLNIQASEDTAIVDTRPVGRPSLLDDAMQEKAKLVVDNIMKQGGSLLEVALELGINRDTLYDWKKKNSIFSDTINKGMMLREIWFEKQARLNVNNKDYNTQLFGLYAMNSIGWTRREKSTSDINVSVSDAIREAASKRISRLDDDVL